MRGEQCLIKTTWKVNPAWNWPGSRTVAMVTAQWVSFYVLPGVYYWYAKFEWHHLNISRDIIDFVIYLLTWTTDDIIHHFLSKNFNILEIKEDLLKKKIPFLLTLIGLSNQQTFYFMGTLRIRIKITFCHWYCL